MTKSYEIPNKLEARSFDELRVLLLQNNMRLGGKVIYDIHPPRVAKGKWYAFYYEKVDATEFLKRQLKQNKEAK